ncbi:hypothetical protein AB4099_34905 [Bosea sp. 2KB_26]|uniref:hypothetical protein n=1 Tax=Bosea sp. 2KB_26 TaxID=3237475 RepID=UPI003F9061FA
MNLLRHYPDRLDEMGIAAGGEEDPVAIGAKWQDGPAAHAGNAATTFPAGRISGIPRPMADNEPKHGRGPIRFRPDEQMDQTRQ